MLNLRRIRWGSALDRSGKAAGTVWFSAAFLLDSSHVFARLRCYAWSSRGSEVGMSFTEQAESLRAKAHLSGVRLPVLVGVTALAVVVLVAAGASFLSVFSSDSLVVEKAGEADVEGASPDRPQEQARTIVVHVGGSVLAPGVYELAESARVQDAIEAAGGFGEQAATDALNLARVLTDGEHVVVPTLSEVEEAAAAARVRVRVGALGDVRGRGRSRSPLVGFGVRGYRSRRAGRLACVLGARVAASRRAGGGRRLRVRPGGVLRRLARCGAARLRRARPGPFDPRVFSSRG